MGRKFDKTLPAMTDEDLAAVDETLLDKKSRQRLATERSRRQNAENKDDRTEIRMWRVITAVISIAGIVAGLIYLL